MKVMMFFIFVLILYLLGNYYVFHHLWVAMPPSLAGKITIISFAVIVTSSFFLYFLARDSMSSGVASFFYSVGTAWIFILIYFVIVFLLKDLIGLANNFIHFMPSDAITRYTKDSWLGLGFMVGFIALVMVCGYLKYQWKVRVDIPINIEKSLGANRDSLKIVSISDLHLGDGIGKAEFEGWIETINKENPDIILIAGDVIDNSTLPLLEKNVAESFKKFKAPLGVYACLGNHEYISGLDKSLKFLNETGMIILRDSHILVDSAFYIVGRDDRTNTKRKEIVDLIVDLDKTKPILLLDHQPFQLEETEAAEIDLQVSGHTHQGQVWPISIITNAMYEVDHGLTKKGNTNIVVSSGIGIWGGKFRIGTQSEYIVITLKNTK